MLRRAGVALEVAKLPEWIGWLRYRWRKLTGKRSAIIEHKGD